MTSEFNVRNPDAIMNKAFMLAGHDELTATVGWGAEDKQQPNYTNILCITDLGNEHHVAGDGNQNIIYNPWQNGTIIEIYSKHTVNIYIHHRKQK